MAQDDPVQIAYLVHFRGGSESGILRKVASQAAAWSDLGAKVGLFVATSPESATAWRALPETVEVRTPPIGPLARLRERESLVRDVERWRPDVVYLRHGLVHPGLIRLARRIPCVVEINGDDLSEFRLTSTRRYLLARATRGLLLRRAAGLVFVTHELAAIPSFAAFGRPGIVIGNGIDLSSVEATPPVRNERPRLVFIGHPDTPWHGLDHVAEIAAAFPEWQLDLIGPRDGELSAAGPRANLAAHGPLDPDDYRPFVEASDVAIGTLGLYRKHMDEASPLKVREYLAAGLPVITGYRDTDFPDGATFILRIPNEPDGVRASLESIGTFVEGWRGRRVPRDLVAHLDVAVKEGARLRFLEATARG
jgi:glycosyltransferase involved in cell wall biosynthesis